jgi:biotin-dependent carboxylase-like uncharacterized protein
MTRTLRVINAGPGVTVQDTGRPGYLGVGLSRGGAADRLALAEGAALLGQDPSAAALEMAGTGGRFEVTEPTRIALTGAPMRVTAGSRPLEWNAVHLLNPGEVLSIGSAVQGVYGYLHMAGGISTEPILGSRAAHLAVRLFGPAKAGETFKLGNDPEPERLGLALEVPDRCSGGMVRLLPNAQTALFSEDERARFSQTEFRRDPRGNRQGVRLDFDGEPFAPEGALSLLSEVVQPGDVQLTGDGAPYVLMPECQTTGGYPRIGTVHPADLPIVAQAQPGVRLRFKFVRREDARAGPADPILERDRLYRAARPRFQDPREIGDLLGYQLISGVVSGGEEQL